MSHGKRNWIHRNFFFMLLDVSVNAFVASCVYFKEKPVFCDFYSELYFGSFIP